MKSKNTKLYQVILMAFAGLQFAFPLFAAAGAATNPTEAAEIQELKQEIQALDQKVEALEQRRAVEQQPTNDASKEQIQALDQKVRVLERLRENDQDAAATVVKAQPKISLGAGGFSFSSADSNFVATLHGLVQVDSRTFQNDNHIQGNDGILLRRARPIFSGTVYHDFDFQFTPDFGNGTPGAASAATTPSIYDAYLNYRYSPALQFEAGKFKPTVGLEYLQSDSSMFFNERSLATDLIPGRDLGFELHGDIDGGVLSYAVGVFNGVGDGQRNTSNTAFQDNRELVARLFVQPFKTAGIAALQNLGLGVGGSWGASSITNTLGLPNSTGGGSTSAGFYTDGQQQFFVYSPASGVGGVVAHGTHWRLSPQAYYYYGPFGLLGEYVISDQGVENSATLRTANLQNTAWQIAGGWVLTGEDATFNGVTPRHPFDPRNGGWGALQLVARYANLDVDKAAFPIFANPATSASEARAWAVGLNWYLNKNIRVNTSFSRTTFTGGGGAGTSVPAAVTQHPEDVFFTRIQLSF
jgi:phosphate-selective porin OprO/OprP